MSPEAVAAPTSDPIATLFPDLETELAMTRKILSIVPWEHAEWKPHPRSGSLKQVASHVAQLPAFATVMAATDVLNFSPADFAPKPVSNTDELVAMFDGEVDKLRASLVGMDWERLGGNWKMVAGEHVILDGSRATMIRHMGINHLVHHRAQLSVYLRLLDVKIPGCYGPSADS